MGVSGAEIREKPAGDIRFCVVPQKPIKNCEKLIFRPIFQKFSKRVRVLPNASRRIQTHLSASEQARAGPSNSENLKKLAKTCEKLAKTSRKTLKKFSRSRLFLEIFVAAAAGARGRTPGTPLRLGPPRAGRKTEIIFSAELFSAEK